MDTLAHLKHLYGFNDWANRIIVRQARSTGSARVLAYLAHVLITEKEYYERLFGKDSTGFNFWPEAGVDDCASLAKENNERFLKLLEGFDDEGLGQRVSYKTSQGVEFENSFREILTHVLFHSMNHRGQILTILREEGFEPPAIDYIVYERTR
ncbi:MAG: DinB family protein [Acidobacteriota bacterium]|nr:DinB family protein [Acidobacteriota bacterium]MDH3530284.1 DinB family protein [Acidobacteriota bacterium]